MFIVEINQIIGAKPLRISVNKSENQLQQQWRVQKWATTTTITKCICEFELGLREREKSAAAHEHTHSRTHLQCECKLSSTSLSLSLALFDSWSQQLPSFVRRCHPRTSCSVASLVEIHCWPETLCILYLIWYCYCKKRRHNRIIQIITCTPMQSVVCMCVC